MLVISKNLSSYLNIMFSVFFMSFKTKRNWKPNMFSMFSLFSLFFENRKLFLKTQRTLFWCSQKLFLFFKFSIFCVFCVFQKKKKTGNQEPIWFMFFKIVFCFMLSKTRRTMKIVRMCLIPSFFYFIVKNIKHYYIQRTR